MADRASLRGNPRLTNFAVGWGSPDLSWIWRAFPLVTHDESTMEYDVLGAEHLQIMDTIISEQQTDWPEIDWQLSQASVTTVLNGVQAFVPDKANATMRQKDFQRKTFLLARLGLLKIVHNILSYVGDNANVTNQGTATLDISSDTTEDIRAQMTTEIRAFQTANGGEDPDHLIIGADLADLIVRHPMVRAEYQYTTPPSGTARDRTEQILSEYFGIENVIVPNAFYNNDNEATPTTTLARVWPTATGLLYRTGPAQVIPGTGGMYELENGAPCFAAIFASNEVVGSVAGVTAFTKRDELRGVTGGDVLRVVWDHKFAITGQQYGRRLDLWTTS